MELIGVSLLHGIICDILKVEFQLTAVKNVKELFPLQILFTGVLFFREAELYLLMGLLRLEVTDPYWPCFAGFRPGFDVFVCVS